MIRRIQAFARFWYGFVVGDDWRIALGILAALALTYVVNVANIPGWWVLPSAVATLLSMSVWRAGRAANLRDQRQLVEDGEPTSSMPTATKDQRGA